MAYMYMLRCADGTTYVGSTVDLERRIAQHQAGEGAEYTRRRRPVELIHVEEYARVDDAFRREKQVQNWSRAKRLALAHGNHETLASASRKRWT
ncbi:GIY-YIG nuclease family protein [Agromyces sp. C10]|uniref:GIY-YIG nuclease family protein n=1 Tax=Agromyces sp. C10 TaxID=2935077 RepID=UPI00200B1D3F|nr:GIY-YIG nuclease family protein [Agromyces sp. C10]MCK8609925.1 GIY-YIG nuclease family protein [Agromyces sp. C10]